MLRRAAALLLIAALPLVCAGRWELQYFHDKDEESLALYDIAFASPRRGIAIGVHQRRGRSNGVALVTADGGGRWDVVPLRESPRSIFFEREEAAWIVTERGIWRSDEAGRSWSKVHSAANLLRVAFSGGGRGVAVGAARTILQTLDGGRTWTKMTGAAEEGSSRFLIYEAVAFAGNKGMIAGSSQRPRGRVPLWMDPEPELRPEEPRLSVIFETIDGGIGWTRKTMSAFGRIAELAMSGSRSLALFRFEQFFRWPSEIFCIDLQTGKSARCFRQSDRALTDIAINSTGAALAAGFEPPGKLPWTPVPGPVKILRLPAGSGDWAEMKVDYRAVATHVSLAFVDENNAWAATDTGMILRMID